MASQNSFTPNATFTVTVAGSGFVGGVFVFKEETAAATHGINDTPYPNSL